jgi:hypothetical protein
MRPVFLIGKKQDQFFPYTIVIFDINYPHKIYYEIRKKERKGSPKKV